MGLVWVCAGCAAQGPVGMERIHSAYRRGQYTAAFRWAQKEVLTGPVVLKDQAAYMAGMSAYQRGDVVTAQRCLGDATRSSEPALAGDAFVMLGLISAGQDRHEAAAKAFLSAAQRLVPGQDRANAYFYAATAQQCLGRWNEARVNLGLARANSHDSGFRDRVVQELQVTGFTLQTGAFGDWANAHRAAEQLLPKTAKLKVGRPWLVPAVDRHNQNLFLVQIGQFSSHASAQAVRARLADSAAMIVPLTKSRGGG